MVLCEWSAIFRLRPGQFVILDFWIKRKRGDYNFVMGYHEIGEVVTKSKLIGYLTGAQRRASEAC